jgi:hypothetical protein
MITRKLLIVGIAGMLLGCGCSDPALVKRVEALEKRNKALEAKLDKVRLVANGAAMDAYLERKIHSTDLWQLRRELHELGIEVERGTLKLDEKSPDLVSP